MGDWAAHPRENCSYVLDKDPKTPGVDEVRLHDFSGMDLLVLSGTSLMGWINQGLAAQLTVTQTPSK